VGSPTIGVYNKEVLEAIGTVIATERTRQGLRTSDLGIDPHIVADIEAGRPGITTTQLETVATALQLDPIALRAGTIAARPRPSVFLLHRGAQDFDAAELPVLDAALEHARARNALARLVGDDVGIFPRRQLAPRGSAGDVTHAPALQGYQLARELRRTLGNEAKALADLRELAEAGIEQERAGAERPPSRKSSGDPTGDVVNYFGGEAPKRGVTNRPVRGLLPRGGDERRPSRVA
jgi:hypothetical protein